jgi:multidrug transporter EmrE-like cation transporter
MLNLRTLGFGSLLAFNDIVMMPFVKQIVGGWPFAYILFPMLAYALDPLIFFFAMKGEGMALMNLVWNLISNVIITFTGIVMFKEVVPPTKMIGIALSFVALFFMTYEGNASFAGK